MTVPRRRRWINDLDRGKYANAGQMKVCRPNEKCPWGRRDICLFAVCVNTFGDGGYVQAEKEDVGEYVQDLGNSVLAGITEKRAGVYLECNTVSPRISHDGPIDKGVKWGHDGQARPL